MNKHFLTIASLLAGLAGSLAQKEVAPINQQELDVRLAELRQHYAPFLRSLPPPMPARPRTRLPAAWRFTHEAKETPKTEGIPPAPEWHGAAFDDSGWEITTVPEWRYRTREGDDAARHADQKDVWTSSETTADTIGWYRTTFNAQPAAAGRRLWLCFEGVEWEAQVWLNGEALGSHRVYYEPFRFDVTGKIKTTNTVAVRVIAGRSYGQPMTYWGLFPDIRAAQQRYVPDRAQSISGNLPIGYHAGCGYGIFRDVYLEETGPVRVSAVFARNSLPDSSARVKVELDGAMELPTELRVDILPENFEGRAYAAKILCATNTPSVILPMPAARRWSPEAPHLYRCRVTVPGSDAMEVLFGCRSFALHQRKEPPPVPTYTFASQRARWLRIVCRGSDRDAWNVIGGVHGLPLARGAYRVSASQSHPDHPPALTLDGKGDTRWAVEGRGEWIQFALNDDVGFDRVTIGWYEAEYRQWDFDLLVSQDGREWTKLNYATTGGGTAELPDGMFLLNGQPVFLRGSSIQGLNAYAYWGQTNELFNALLLLKAGNFNAVRSCQHVEFPEVLEWMDRVGIMSEQDQGGGYRGSLDTGIRREQHIHTGTVLARQTYNHPGVVLLCFGNEHEFPTEPIVRAALAVDPERIFKPISGRISHSRKPWDLPADLRANALDDSHPYTGWYGNIVPQTWRNLQIYPPGRMITLGEFGAEALDAYATMRDHYPPQFRPPPPETDTLWAASQVQKRDVRQIAGLGCAPTNLVEYIEASQGYQASLVADKVIGMRLSPRAIAGYFHFYFLDVIPAYWPKSIVSHDHRPKAAYYQLAQINQPVVALPQLEGEHPDAMTLWVANDLTEAFPGATLSWTVGGGGARWLAGQQTINIPALGAAPGERVDLRPVTMKQPAFDLELLLTKADGRELSRYRRTVRVVAAELLKVAPSEATADPFNQRK
jgi:hypothetical protein